MRYIWISIKYIRLRDIILSIRYPLIEYLIKMFRMKVPQSKRAKRNVSISENFLQSLFQPNIICDRNSLLWLLTRGGLWNWGVARQPCSFSDQQIQQQIQTNTFTTICTNTTAKQKQTRQSKHCGFCIYIFDNQSKSMVRLVRAEMMVLSGLVFARKIARMILIQNV